jgi:hypothetical protein
MSGFAGTSSRSWDGVMPPATESFLLWVAAHTSSKRERKKIEEHVGVGIEVDHFERSLLQCGRCARHPVVFYSRVERAAQGLESTRIVWRR